MANQIEKLEVKIHYPESYQAGSDPLLEEWLSAHWDSNYPVLVFYGSKEECTVVKNDLITRQSYLPDRRLLRCDWSSPQSRQDQGSYFVRVEL